MWRSGVFLSTVMVCRDTGISRNASTICKNTNALRWPCRCRPAARGASMPSEDRAAVRLLSAAATVAQHCRVVPGQPLLWAHGSGAFSPLTPGNIS